MEKFLAILNGSAEDGEKASLSEQQQIDFMSAWGAWAQTNGSAFLDPGAPLYMKKRVTARGVEDFVDTKTGYAIVEAESHDAAVQIFADHPHLDLHPGNWIEVLQCPEIPS